MNKQTILVIIVVLAIVLAGIVIYTQTKSPAPLTNSNPQSPVESSQPTTTETKPATETKPISETVSPISDASSRITKKFYGTYVTPASSPVTPEKFTGFHTGLDFETTPAEKDSDVVINAICSGKLLRKTTATGYGGYAIQSCRINDKDVTVVYGHLRLSSIGPKVGDELKDGDKLGLLGTGYSSETSGERKHLHLSIHLGTGIDIKGYVQTQPDLSAWMDPKVVLGL